MSTVLEKIKSEENIDVVNVFRGENKGVYLVETTITKFKTKDVGGADIVKKVNAYAEGKSLDDALDKSLNKAGELLGLGLEE